MPHMLSSNQLAGPLSVFWRSDTGTHLQADLAVGAIPSIELGRLIIEPVHE